MSRPFLVYKSSATAFTDSSSDIIGIATPSVAEYEIEYNGAGTLHIEHPADNEGKWKRIQCGAIVFAPIMRRNQDFPQPFRIYKVTKTRRNGVPIITADCMHVFYDLNFATVIPNVNGISAHFSGFTVNEWLNGKDIGGGQMRGLPVAANWATWIHNYYPSSRENLFWNKGDSDYWYPAYNLFTASSNVSGTFDFYCNGETIAEHLIGNGNSVSKMTGGILYVDKYTFSMNNPMENSQTNSFQIAYGLNLEGITQIIDNSNVITLLNNDSNLSIPFSAGYVKPSVKYAETGFSFSRQVNAQFNYSTNNESATGESFREDSAQYFSERSTPTVSYLINLTAKQVSDEIANIATYEVGDTGTIYDPDLDIDTTQSIVKKKVDLITQRVKSVELASLGRYRTKAQWQRTITSGQEALEKRIDSLGASI